MEKDTNKLQKNWNLIGEQYATGINELVAYIEEHGYDSWKGKEPEDTRSNLADGVIKKLQNANVENQVDKFRADFPPAHAPIAHILKDKGQSINQLNFINSRKIVFFVGSAWETRQGYLLDNDVVTVIDSTIQAIGKSHRNDIFAFGYSDRIVIRQSWEGEMISEIYLTKTKDMQITELIPFNDGQKVILVSNKGIYLISNNEEKLIHPNDNTFLSDSNDSYSHIDMENATLSNDNHGSCQVSCRI